MAEYSFNDYLSAFGKAIGQSGTPRTPSAGQSGRQRSAPIAGPGFNQPKQETEQKRNLLQKAFDTVSARAAQQEQQKLKAPAVQDDSAYAKGVDFYKNSPMASAPNKQKGTGNLTMDSKIVAAEPYVLAQQGEKVASAARERDDALKRAELADRRAGDIMSYYGGKRDETGTVVFSKDGGAEKYNELQRQAQGHLDAALGAEKNMTKAVEAYNDAAEVAAQAKTDANAAFDKLPETAVGVLAKHGNAAAAQYVSEKEASEYKELTYRAEQYISDGGTIMTAVDDYQSEEKAYRKVANDFFSAATLLNDYVDSFLQSVQNDSRAEALRAARDKDLAEGEKLSNKLTYTEYANFFAEAVRSGLMDGGFVPDELTGAKALAPAYYDEREKMENAANDRQAMWAYQIRAAQGDEKYKQLAKPDISVADDIGGDIGEIYKFLAKETGSADIEDVRKARYIHGKTLTADAVAQMTEEEKALFFYYCNTGDDDMAELLLASLADSLAVRAGEVAADALDIPGVRFLSGLFIGFGKGIQKVMYGAGSLVADIDPPDLDSTDYMLASWNDKYKGTFYGYTLGAAENIGNMLPSTAGYLVNPYLGRSITFLSARGDAYIDAKRSGYTHGQAWAYSTMVGASETFLENVLGMAGGVMQGALPKKLSAVIPEAKGWFGKLAKDFVIDAGGELLEENLQNYLEPAFKMIVGAEDKYDAPGFEEFTETSIITIMTTAFFKAFRFKSDKQRYKAQETLDNSAMKWADVALKADKDSEIYKDGQWVKEYLESGEHVSAEMVDRIINKTAAAYSAIDEQTQMTQAQVQAQETQQRAEQVQEQNPDATVIKSSGTQAYIDKGAKLEVAQQAGEVLDKIVSGELTSVKITSKQIDLLRPATQYGRDAIKEVLGVEVKTASSAAARRAAVRETIARYEKQMADAAREAAAKSAVATAGISPVQVVPADGVQTDAQSYAPTEARTTAPASASAADGVSSARVVPAQNGAVATVSQNPAQAQTLMTYKEFKRRVASDKEFRKRYIPENKKLSEEERTTIAYENYRAESVAGVVQRSVKGTRFGVERNEYSAKVDERIVSAVDALAKLFRIKVRFSDLGGDNGLYHADTGEIELDIAPYHSGAKDAFLFTAAHEIGHAVKARLSAAAWNEFSQYAIAAKGGESAVKEKQESSEVYAEASVAREEVVCDFIGELLSDQETLNTFCESIRNGKVKAETAHGIVAAWRKITNLLRGKGANQTDAATAALVQRVQEQFGTDIETAENAVREMQKALSAAMEADAQNKNAAETGDGIRHSLKDAMKIGFDQLIKQYFEKKISRANPIFISNAPKNAEAMFKTNVPFIISSSDMTKSTRENNGSSRSAHALSKNFIEHLPKNIEESVIGYLENRSGVNSFTFVCFDKESNSLVAVGGALNVLYEGQTVNRVLSIFHISTPESFLTKSGKDIVTTDIKKAKNILEKARIQSPALQDILDSARIVTQTNSESQEKNQKNNVDGDTLHSKKDVPRRVIPTPEEARALDERIKAREAEKEAERIRIRDEAMRKLVENSPANVAWRERNNLKRSAKDNLAEMADKNGRMPQGENPVRDVTVPVSTDGETKVRSTVRTAMEAKATPEALIPKIEESIIEGSFNYKPKKNAETMEAAREWVERRKTVDDAYKDWLSAKRRHLNADMVARGLIIYNNYANAAETVTSETERVRLQQNAVSILQDISVMATIGGQTSQAMRLLKQQTPEAQYYALERAVQKLQDGINDRYRGKESDAPKIEIDKARAGKWMQALREGDMELAYDLEAVLFQNIASQIPKTLGDRLNAWRYLSMLGNPKTLIRNAVGNAAFTPVVMLKDKVGAAMELFLKKEKRTKYLGLLHASEEGRALLKFASEDGQSADVLQLMERNKYDDTSLNDRLARYVQEKKRTFTAPVLKQWQAATRYMMEKAPFMGDEFYKNVHYRRAFAGAAMARGYTVADLTSGKVSETELMSMRVYAANQAMKATFNDANKVSDLVSRFRFKNKVANTALEGTLPFKRTPANVAVRSFEYSPAGLLKALSTDIYALKTGKITGQEYIERLSQGVTGSVMFGLGILASVLGIVRVNVDDDDEREGRQSYSLEVFGESVTLDWLAPTSVAFFMGAEAQELFAGRGEDQSFLDAMLDSTSNLFAPVLEMTALSGAKDLLDTFVYSYKKDGADAGQIVLALFVQPFLSYLGQYAPTIFGQVENMFEPYRTTTYVGDVNGKVDRVFVRNFAKILEKVPFVDWRQIEYVDEWGRKDYNGDIPLRFFNSFINPAYVNDIVPTEVDAEVRRIKETTGKNVSPTKRGYKITVSEYDEDGEKLDSREVVLSAEQYRDYQMEYGTQYALMAAALMASEYYDTLSDSEKAKAFKEIESLADEYGKLAANVGYMIDPGSTDNKLYSLVQMGMPAAEAYSARLMYTQINNDDDMKPVERYEQFRVWVYGNDAWTEEEKQAVIDRFGKFSSGFVAESENFDKMLRLGIDADKAMSINDGIRNLKPEDGLVDVSQSQKYGYILNRSDLNIAEKNAAIKSYMSSNETDAFAPCEAAGITATEYAEVVLKIGTLEPIGESKGVTAAQKYEVCVKSFSSEAKQDAMLRRYMSAETEAKYDTLRDSGVSPATYVAWYSAKYTYGDGNGSWKQDELEKWLRENVSSRAQRAALWDATNAGWKNNPFK